MEGEPRKSHPIFPGMTTVLLSRDRRRVRGPLSSALRHESACRHLLVAAAAPTPHRHSAPRPPPRHSGESRKPRTSYQWTMVSPDPRGRGPRLSPGRLGWDGGPPVFHPPTPRHSGESRKPRTPDPRGQRVDSTLRYPKRGGDVDPGFRPPVIPAKAGNHAPPPASPSQARAATKSNESQFKTTPPPNPRGRGPRLSPPHPSFRRKPETTPPTNPQGRGPRLSPGRRSRAPLVFPAKAGRGCE